jgi:phosphatidylglycerophosphate synthase
MSRAADSNERQRLASWSRAHAPAMLAASAWSVLVGRPWPVGVAALLSFAVLLVRFRGAWAAERRIAAPNLVTALRLAIMLAVGVFLHGASGVFWAGAVGLVFALDGLDGWLARRGDATSAFGAHFDMETDALTALVVTFELWTRGQLGAWILTGGLLRYLYVVAVALVPPRAGEMPRSKFGRRAFVALVLRTLHGPGVPTGAGAAAAPSGAQPPRFLLPIVLLVVFPAVQAPHELVFRPPVASKNRG